VAGPDAHDRRPKPKPKPKQQQGRRSRQPGGGGRPLPGSVTLDPQTGRVYQVGNPIDEAVRSQAPEGKRATAARQSETLRRQRLLASLGYGLVVDGIWGPRSQSAWNDYMAKRRKNPGAFGPLKFEGQAGKQNIPYGGQSPEQIRAEKRYQAEQARKEALRRDVAYRAKIVERSKLLSAAPRRSAEFKFHEVAEVVLNPEGKLGLRTSAGARIFQTWAAAHGWKVRVTGKYDKQTHDAMEGAMRREVRQAKRRRISTVRDKLYGPLGVEAGQKPYWWTFDEPIPTAARLSEMLQKGGFEASLMLNTLLKQSTTGDAAFAAIRRQELMKLAATLRATGSFNPFDNPLFAKVRGGAPSDLRLLAEILGQTDLAPTVDVSKLSPEQQAIYQRMRSGSQSVQAENVKRVGALRAEVMALARSKNEDDFKQRLGAYMALEEQKFHRYQSELAGRSLPWWGSAVENALDLGRNMRTAFVYDAMRATQLVLGDDERAVQWEDAAVTLGADPDTLPFYDGLVDKAANRWLRLAFELTADPINFAHPFRAASSLLRYGTKGSTLGSYSLREKGILGADNLILRAKRANVVGGIVYGRGTWSKAAVAERATFGFARHDSAAGARELARKSTQLKEEALASARERTTRQARHGFMKPVSKFAAHVEVRLPRNATTRRLLEEARREMMGSVGREWAATIDDLIADRASLYVDAGRGQPSQVGAALRANLAERYRVLSVYEIARDYYREVYETTLETLGDDAIDAAREAADSEYDRIVEGAGVYLKAGAADKKLRLMIERRVADRMAELDTSIFPDIQNILERQADAALDGSVAARKAGDDAVEAIHPLWDEGGLWRGRSGTTAKMLVRLGRESFEEGKTQTIRNPQAGIGFTWDEATEMIESEVARRSGRLYSYVARNRAAGTLSDDFDLDRLLVKEYDDVVESWEKTGGLWYDTRETIEVSDLYARHIGGIARRRVEDGAKRVPLSDLAKPPGFVAGGAFDDDLWSLATKQGSHLEEDALYREALTKRQFALARAYDETISHELISETAVWQALAHAQSKPLKVAYLGLSGALNLWIFATLPLRPGWAFRNIVDNLAKTIIAGVHDPRMLFLGGRSPGNGAIRSVFDFGLRDVREAIGWMDQLFGTTGLDHWMEIERRIWEMGADVLRKVFNAHGLEDIPDSLLDSAVFNPFEQKAVRAGRPRYDKKLAAEMGLKRLPRESVEATAARVKKFREGAWDLLAARPENYFKRVIYRDTHLKSYARMLRDGDHLVAGAVTRTEEAERLVPTEARLKKRPLDRYAPAWYDVDGRVVVGQPGQHHSELKALRPEVAEWNQATIVFEDGAVARINGGLLGQTAISEEPVSELVDAAIRALYEPRVVSEAIEELDEIGLRLAAHDEAWAKIEDTLFDYSKITVVEDNLRIFFPFIQFWRKNSAFWVKSFAQKPWLTNAVLQLDQARQDAHADLPQWMRRYMHVDEVTDSVAFIPGLDKVVAALLPSDVMYDPMNLSSFAPFYRAFKKTFYGENPALPTRPEDEGNAIFGPMLDAVNDWGLGFSPFGRKLLESTNVATDRAWQAMFPQTGPAVALTREWFGERWAGRVANWESIFTLMQGDTPSDQISSNFEFFVQQEISNQVARGETPNRKAAEQTIEDWFVTQNLFGYFTGMYLRRATPEDILLSKLSDELMTGRKDYEALTSGEALSLRLRPSSTSGPMDRMTFNSYLDLLPLIEAYYRSDGWEEKQRMKREHPELIRWVDATYRGRPFSSKWLRDSQRYVETEKFMMALRVVEAIDPAHDVRQAALDIFKTPELEAYWKSNDTPKQVRESMIRAAAFEYYGDLNSQFHELPDDDYEAKEGFLDEHPELVRYWNRNNDPADDMEAMLSGANAALREEYFSLVKRGGFSAGAPLLRAFSFMFEDTRAASKVDEATGEWKAGVGRGGKWSAERRNAYLAVKPHLDWFFRDYMKRVGEKQAWAWLEASDGKVAQSIKGYLKKWGKHSQKSVDYLRAKSWLKLYFDMAPSARGAWLHGDSEGAKIVLDFFAKYAKRGHSAHAHDYLAAKGDLSYYFSLPKGQRSAWLESSDPRAARVLDYFKKYGKTHQYERAFLRKYPQLVGGTPEQRKRLEFWRLFFKLSPDKRPAFVLAEAENYGVFIYGEFGEEERHDREQEYLRRAVALGASERQAAYLYAKPLLDTYFALPEKERALFARANPEIQEYLDKYGDRKVTGNAKLDAIVEEYFHLPPDSFARSQFLRDHPELQDWFDLRSSPAERAMHNLLEQYFSIPSGPSRDEFLAMHPEVAAWFERRRAERSAEGAIYDAFDQADPRLRPYFQSGEDLIRAAEAMRRRLREQALKTYQPDTIESRRDRRPVAA